MLYVVLYLQNFVFATNAKMVLVNNDQCMIADIALALWLKIKKNIRITLVCILFSRISFWLIPKEFQWRVDS